MRQKVDILKAGISDIPEIADVEEKCIPGGWSEKGFLDWLKNENTVIFKAVLDDEIIGFANASWVLDEGELLNIAVVENYRNMGIAKELFNYLEKYLKDRKVEKIFLEVRKKNIPAINFYEKHGFIKNGLRKDYYKNPADNGVLMMKNIGE